jgi:hypothetical protein
MYFPIREKQSKFRTTGGKPGSPISDIFAFVKNPDRKGPAPIQEQALSVIYRR